VLDDRCREHWAPDGNPLGSEWLRRWRGDVTIARAIRFARNRVHHQWAEAWSSVLPLSDRPFATRVTSPTGTGAQRPIFRRRLATDRSPPVKPPTRSCSPAGRPS
jgi:hypothetical protein